MDSVHKGLWIQSIRVMDSVHKICPFLGGCLMDSIHTLNNYHRGWLFLSRLHGGADFDFVENSVRE